MLDFKLYYVVPDSKQLRSLKDIENQKIRNLITKRAESKKPTVVQFGRTVAQNPARLYVALNNILEKNIFFIEIKARRSRKTLLKETIRFIISRGGVQTTHGKLGFIKGQWELNVD